MTGRQHSIVKHRENYFYVPLEDDYLLAYTLLAESLDPIKEKQGKRPSGSSDCKAMIASIIESWMNSKRATATCEDDLYVYFTHDQMVQELRGRYKRTMVIQCLQEMETEGEYTDPATGEVYAGTIKKRPHKQHISKYVLNLPVLQALLNDLPAQSPFDKSLNITLGRPKKYRSKTDDINEEKSSSEKYRINLDGINEKPSENGRNNEEIPSKNGLPFYTQNSIITQNSKDTEGESATSNVSSTAHVSDDNAPTRPLVFHPLHNFIALDDAIAPKVMTVFMTPTEYYSEQEDKSRERIAVGVQADLEKRGHHVTFKWEQEDPASFKFAPEVVDASSSQVEEKQASANSPIATDSVKDSPAEPPQENKGKRNGKGSQTAKPAQSKLIEDEPVQPKRSEMPPAEMKWGTNKCKLMFDAWRGAPLMAQYKLNQSSGIAKNLSTYYSEDEVKAAKARMDEDDYYVQRGGADIFDVGNNISKYLNIIKNEAKKQRKQGGDNGKELSQTTQTAAAMAEAQARANESNEAELEKLLAKIPTSQAKKHA
jgi:hypothetical protein